MASPQFFPDNIPMTDQRYSDILTEEFGKLSQGSNKTRGAAVKKTDA